MSPVRATRSRARKASTASVSSVLSKGLSESVSKPRSKSTSQSRPASNKGKSTRGKTQQARDVWCICRGSDNGTPMVRCESCKDWFHFTCIGLSEREAEDIQLYICSACHDKTGKSTVYDWEGPDAVEEYQANVTEIRVGSKKKEEEKSFILVEDPSDEDDDGEADEYSGDDYMEEEASRATGVRRGRGTQIITSSEDEGLSPGDEPSRRTSSRHSQLKRKRGRESHAAPRKRLRKPSSEIVTEDEDVDSKRREPSHSKVKRGKNDAVLDPTRKYCSGKLREVLVPIFVQFANAAVTEAGRTPENDTERERKAEEDGTAYVQDLEQCLFEAYGEIDKRGEKSASAKYKDRFRMLSFNLSQPDRHVLRRSIGTHAIPASQLAHMSSVELANEQTKLQIEAANRESLEHSILVQRPAAARAKITHKGEEVIEDLNGDDVARRLRDEEQREAEREREREKDAREKAKMTPVSPIYQGPQDILAQQHNAASQKAAQARAQAQAQALGSSTSPISSTFSESLEPAIKLDELIAIDLHEDSPSQDTATIDAHRHVIAGSPTVSPSAAAVSSSPKSDEASPRTKPRSASFDLSNVWSGSPTENPPVRPGSPMPSRTEETREGPAIDIDLGTAADDEDFDMFLDQAEPPVTSLGPSGPESEQAIFEALPIVWSGHLNLPDSGKSPLVQARQVGGRPIDVSSSHWHILFPSGPTSQIRVDGRVPVKDSAKYMTQNRLNVTRELIVVALTPLSERGDFDEIISFLVNRDRHAVVHPWGPNPSPEAPGKELYLIPIMPHEALPDYIEILDLVKFPKHRDDKVLLGVFILNKGKFSEQIPKPPMPPAMPQLVPTLESHPATATAQVNQQGPSIPPEIISKLSTQQIESLLQTVLSGGMSSLPLPQPQQQPQPQSQPLQLPHPPPPSATFAPPFPASLSDLLPQQQYPSLPYSQYPPVPPPQQPQYPPPARQQPPPLPYNYAPPPQRLPSSPPRDQDYRRSPPYGNDRSRAGEFGGRKGARGSGRYFSGDRGRGGRGDFDRPRDSGWGGRGRGRGGTQKSPPRPW